MTEPPSAENILEMRQIMRIERQIDKIIRENGYILVRSQKHNIWKNNTGEIIVSSKSPSCPFTYKKIRNRINSNRNAKLFATINNRHDI